MADSDQAQKDLPIQFVEASKPLQAQIVIGSFGSSAGFKRPVFELGVQADSNGPVTTSEKPLRYGKVEEIHHIFRADPTSPPKMISLVFAAAVLATVPVILGLVSVPGFSISCLAD